MTYRYDDNGNVLSETLSGVMAPNSFTTEKTGAGTYATQNTNAPSNEIKRTANLMGPPSGSKCICGSVPEVVASLDLRLIDVIPIGISDRKSEEAKGVRVCRDKTGLE